LLANDGAAMAFRGGIVCGQELGRDHAFDVIFWADPNKSSNRGLALPVTGFRQTKRHPLPSGRPSPGRRRASLAKAAFRAAWDAQG